MVSVDTILWEVDAQADFMLPGGKLYVPGAEKIIPNIGRLVDQARQGRVLLISSADAHQPDDPEFQRWPPHCVKGTAGAELIPEARAARLLAIPNQSDFVFPGDLSAYQQILLQKNTLDVFEIQIPARSSRGSICSRRIPRRHRRLPAEATRRPTFL